MITQFRYFIVDVKRMLGKNKLRVFYIWMSRSFCGILLYRIERGLFCTFGKAYKLIRILLLPFTSIMQAYSNVEIHYAADIKGGILILHPSAGIVISGLSIISENITLTGGNIIGSKFGTKKGEIEIGSNCNLGANAVILGPIILGNNLNIAAMACVVKNCNIDGAILIGVPAKVVNKRPNLPE